MKRQRELDQEMDRIFVVLLKFSEHRERAARFLEGHRAWIAAGIDDGVFLVVGGLEPNQGGVILAHNTSLPDLERRVEADPFVGAHVVTAEILEIAPAKADERLAFLLR